MFLLLLYFCIQLSWARYGSIINGIGCVKLQFYITTVSYTHLLEAISMAGDLSIYGKRDAIFVIREENGERVTPVSYTHLAAR